MLNIKSSLRKHIFLRERDILCGFQTATRNFADNPKNYKSDLYETLGLTSTATQAEIKKAYYDLTFKFHPDRNEGNKEASQKFRDVSDAYEVLGNYSLKKRYDKGLPVDLIKNKPISFRSPVVEKDVKYQKFYDSLVTKEKYEWQRKQSEISRLSAKDQVNDDYFTNKQSEVEKSRSLQVPVSIGISLLIIYHVFYKGLN